MFADGLALGSSAGHPCQPRSLLLASCHFNCTHCGIPNTDTLLYSGAQTLYVQMHVRTYVTDRALLQSDKEIICIFWHLVTSQTRPPVFVQVGCDHSHKPGVKHHCQLQIIVLYPICAYVYPVQTCGMRH